MKPNLLVAMYVSGSKHFHLLLSGGEISEKVSISRKFKQEIVQPILKVKLNFDHKNWRGLFFGGGGMRFVGQTTDGKLKPFSNVHFSQARFKRRTLHVPNLMQMSENNRFFSFALDSAHVKFDV